METPEPKPVPERLRRFDVVRALVYFEEHDGRRKERPMVIICLSGDGETEVGIKCTSNPTWSDKEHGAVRISRWREAGLEHETTARCRQLVRFRRSKLIGYYGRLDLVDVEAIAEALPQLKPEEFIWLSDER